MIAYRNACVLTMNDRYEVIPCGCVATEGSQILYVGENRDFPGAQVYDCAGKVIMPGFINGHTHMPMTLFRGFADNLPLHEWLNQRIFPLEARHTEETQYRGALLAAAELTRCGVTTVNDMYYDGRIIARVLKESGLSGIVSTCLIGIANDCDRKLMQAMELADAYRDDPDIRTAIAPHAEYTATVPLLERWARAAVDSGQPIHIHCSETRTEHEECKQRHHQTPVGLFESLGFFETPTFLAHCVWVEEADIDRVVAGGATVLHNPCSNLKLASGFAPIPLMLEKGIKIALATDGSASNNTQDLWEEMRVAALIHKGYTGNAAVLTSREALWMATRGAALALGYKDRGALVEGLRADLIVIDRHQPAYCPDTDIQNLMVYSGNSRDIELTIAGGKVLYDRGQYRMLDIERIYAQCEESFSTVFRNIDGA